MCKNHLWGHKQDKRLKLLTEIIPFVASGLIYGGSIDKNVFVNVNPFTEVKPG